MKVWRISFSDSRVSLLWGVQTRCSIGPFWILYSKSFCLTWMLSIDDYPLFFLSLTFMLRWNVSSGATTFCSPWSWKDVSGLPESLCFPNANLSFDWCLKKKKMADDLLMTYWKTQENERHYPGGRVRSSVILHFSISPSFFWLPQWVQLCFSCCWGLRLYDLL